MIHKKFGEKIQEFRKNSTITLAIHFQLVFRSFLLLIYIEKPPQQDDVAYEIWLSSSNNQSNRFLREMKEWNEKIINHTMMTPHYGVFSSKNSNDNNCLAEGKYCSPDPGIEFYFLMTPIEFRWCRTTYW